MPKVIVDGKTFLLKWPAEMDEQILFVSQRYIKIREGKPVVDWETAMACGEFDDFPKKDIRLISGRYYTLKLRRDQPKLYKKRLKEKNKKARMGSHNGSSADWRKKIHDIWNSMPLEDKLKHGYKPRNVWSKAQKKTLSKLVEKYRQKNGRTNWGKLIEDKKASGFPEKYQTDYNKLRYYYWSIVSGERLYEKKKLYNKRYVEKNRKKCRGYLSKREKMIRKGVVEFLSKKLSNPV